jgi:hypothetical protein
MPQARIIPHPVYAHHVDPQRWWNRHGAPLLVLGEYDKYLVTLALPLLQAWWPPPPAGPALRTAGNFAGTRGYAR